MKGMQLLLRCVSLLVGVTTTVATTAPSFRITNNSFMLDGAPVQLMSCSFHYSRAPAELWNDRLRRLQAMGCNTIQTYVPWNWHEAEPGQFDFSTGARNLGAFLSNVHALGMLTIVRAGPYMVCSCMCILMMCSYMFILLCSCMYLLVCVLCFATYMCLYHYYTPLQICELVLLQCAELVLLQCAELVLLQCAELVLL